MARFKFTQKFGATPSSTDYNTVVSDFTSYIDGKLNKDNFQDESIRFRHLDSPATRIAFKDCSDDIWSADSSLSAVGRAGPFFGTWQHYSDKSVSANSNCVVKNVAVSDLPGVDLVEFTLWYFPYSIYSESLIAPGIRIKATGSWVELTDHERPAGIAVGFYTESEQTPYNHDPTVMPKHPMLTDRTPYRTGVGRQDRLRTIAYGGPIICTITVPKSGVTAGGTTYALEDIDAFGMMVKHNKSADLLKSLDKDVGVRTSMCSPYDRLYLSLIARGY